MRFRTLLLSALAPFATLASEPQSSPSDINTDSTTIYYQPITHLAPAPAPLAKISYNPSTLSSSILDYFPPSLSSTSASPPSNPTLFRIGLYSPSSKTWKSSTSVTSQSTFEKGYALTFVVTLDGEGAVVGVSVKGSRIDAGATRDFGPKVVVRATKRGKGPVLNKPVVLNAAGKLDEVVPEKTLLQKYWWVGLGLVMLLASSGGGE